MTVVAEMFSHTLQNMYRFRKLDTSQCKQFSKPLEGLIVGGSLRYSRIYQSILAYISELDTVSVSPWRAHQKLEPLDLLQMPVAN